MLSQRRAGYATVWAARVLEWILWVSLAIAVALAVALVAPMSVVCRRCSSAAHHDWRRSRFSSRWRSSTRGRSHPILRICPATKTATRFSTRGSSPGSFIKRRARRCNCSTPNFFPEPNTLAFSEALLVQAAMGAPLFWAGVSPVLVQQPADRGPRADRLDDVPGARPVDRRLVGRIWRACLVGFNAHTLTRMAHLQAMHVEFLPFALYAFDRCWSAESATAVSGGRDCLQALTSYYLLVMTAFAMRPPSPFVPKHGGKARADARAAAGAAGWSRSVVLVPYLLPYWSLSHGGFERPIEDVAGRGELARLPHDAVQVAAAVPRELDDRQRTVSRSRSPTLAMVAVVSGVALRDRGQRICLAFGIVGVMLSFGPELPGYAWLYHVLPPLQAIRAVSRFGYLGIVATAVLCATECAVRHGPPAAGGGPARRSPCSPFSRWSRRRHRSTTASTQVPGIYNRLALERDAVVIELPLPAAGSFFNAPFMLNSIVHWKPMVNGYSGFFPDSYVEHYNQLNAFPASETIAALRRLGVTHAFVHLGALGPAHRANLDRTAGLIKLAVEGDTVLCQVASSFAHK